MADEFGNDGSGPVRYATRVVQGQVVQPRFINLPPAYVQANGDHEITGSPTINPPAGVTIGLPLRRLGFAPLRSVINRRCRQVRIRPSVDCSVPLRAARDGLLAAVGLPDTFDQAFVGEPTASQRRRRASRSRRRSSICRTCRRRILTPGTRVTLFSLNGRQSQVRSYPGDGVAIALNGSNWDITWTDPLPSGYGTISEVRVEFPEPRYSWMLTVRKRGTAGGSVTKIDCVVFFNRPTGDPTQELVYVGQSGFSRGRFPTVRRPMR